MNRLRNCRCYLIGAMDKIPGGGVIWRRRIQEDLRHFGIHWLDPTNKPCKMGVEDEASRELRHAKKEQGDWQWVANQMYPIRQVDLRMVDISDFLIVFLDKANSGFGTICELTRANEQMKPILVMQECGKKFMPDWIFGMGIPSSMLFGDWGDLYEYLTCVNECTFIKTEKRWLFFNWQGTQKPGTSESAATFDEGHHFNFDRQGFYKDELGFPWPENLMR